MSVCLCRTLAFLKAIAACFEWSSNGHQSSSSYLLRSPGSLHAGACLMLSSYGSGCRLQITSKKFELFLSTCVTESLTGASARLLPVYLPLIGGLRHRFRHCFQFCRIYVGFIVDERYTETGEVIKGSLCLHVFWPGFHKEIARF